MTCVISAITEIGFMFWFGYSPGLNQGLFYNMKILYTILFFADTMMLILVAYLFLHLSDGGMSVELFMLLSIALLACILILILVLVHYLKLPSKSPR
jgi:hypothetical protein